MSKQTGFYTVEWSERQQLFHIDKLERTYADMKSGNSDWRVIGLFTNVHDAEKLTRRLRRNPQDLSIWPIEDAASTRKFSNA